MFGNSSTSMAIANAVDQAALTERSAPGWERYFGRQATERRP